MRLNRIETFLMNNPVRSLLQRRYEAPLFERLGGRTSGLDVIEIGCGRGVGTELILQRFGARSVFAFDFDPAMIERAARRLERFPKSVVHLSVADAPPFRSLTQHSMRRSTSGRFTTCQSGARQ